MSALRKTSSNYIRATLHNSMRATLRNARYGTTYNDIQQEKGGCRWTNVRFAGRFWMILSAQTVRRLGGETLTRGATPRGATSLLSLRVLDSAPPEREESARRQDHASGGRKARESNHAGSIR